MFAFRRTLEGEQPVVSVLNNGDEPLELSSLPGGGVPLLGTFEITGLESTKRKDCRSKGKGRHRTGLRTGRSHRANPRPQRQRGGLPRRYGPRAYTARRIRSAGQSGAVNPDLGNVTSLTALPGDGAVKLAWEPTDDDNVLGYRVYYREVSATTETLFNFSPLPRDTREVVVYGPQNGITYSFRVVSVDSSAHRAAAHRPWRPPRRRARPRR